MEGWDDSIGVSVSGGLHDDEQVEYDYEEANFYHTLSSFKDLIRRHGIKVIVRGLDNETEEKLFNYYFQQINKEEEYV